MLQVGWDPPEAGAASPGTFPTGHFQVQPHPGLYPEGNFLLHPLKGEREGGKERKYRVTGIQLQLRGMEQTRALPQSLVTDGAVGAAHLLGHNPH